MCGIAGFVSLDRQTVPKGERRLAAMSHLIAHRGPDGNGEWLDGNGTVGLAHRRLAIIDLSPLGAQPMHGRDGTVMVFNGEIYNFPELRRELSTFWDFKGHSDSEVLIAAWTKWGEACVDRLRGMFAFAIWDAKTGTLFCARDRFGIKPFYYTVQKNALYFASEIKALLPVLPEVATDGKAMSEYLTFQFAVTERTLFAGVTQLMPGHCLTIDTKGVRTRRYWDVTYNHDNGHSAEWWAERLREKVNDSIKVHLRSDVPVGSYLSGGVDSGLTTLLASQNEAGARMSFHGKFTQYPGYDESHHAEVVARQANTELYQIDITADDFRDNISKVIYHLDTPVAGPGSFPQYMVSGLAARHLKVVIGGQGGDEIFGGYARYFVGYLEALLKSGITGSGGDIGPGWDQIAPNLNVLREYVPMLRQFWHKGLFDSFDSRYLRLIDRSADMHDEIDWSGLDVAHAHAAFMNIFNDREAIPGEQPFDRMTRFDFKCLLPALLQVEDRMSMAHGLESRVPFLDHDLVEFVATAPTEIKFEGGRMKQMLRRAFDDTLPQSIFDRRDKMGFPVPLKEWWAHDLKDYVHDLFGSAKARSRPYLRADNVLKSFAEAGQFSRKTWGLLSLELWHQQFHDKAQSYRTLVDRAEVAA
jgi:asparagine synthase (glutamine-hydrolysing)